MLVDRKIPILKQNDPGLKPGEVFNPDMLGPWRLREALARGDLEWFERHGGQERFLVDARAVMAYAQDRIAEIEAGLERQRKAAE